MAKLTGQTIAASYDQLLIVDHADGISASLQAIEAGDTGGSASSLKISTSKCEVIPASNSLSLFEVSQADGTAVLSVDTTNARVGIGIAAPGSLLEVRGSTGTGAASAGVLTLSTSETTVRVGTVDQLGRIDFQAPVEGGGTDAILVGASIWAECEEDFSSSNNSTGLVFATGTTAAASEKMRIDQDGNVGMGIDDPVYDLDIVHEGGSAGRINLTTYRDSSGSSGLDLRFARSDNEDAAGAKIVETGDTIGAIAFYPHNDTNFNLQTATIMAVAHTVTSTSNIKTDMIFAVDPTGTAYDLAASPENEAMRIQWGGNIGMGTGDTIEAQLHVKGDASNDGILVKFDNRHADVDDDDIILQLAFGGDTNGSAGHFIEFIDGDGTEIGVIHLTGANAMADAYLSDYRRKENIVPISKGLEEINLLKPIEFNMIRKSEGKQFDTAQGFLAHEVQEAGLGFAVTGEKDAVKTQGKKNHANYGQVVPAYQQLCMRNLIPAMVKAIQELSAKVTALENA